MDVARKIKEDSVFLFDSGIGGITVLDALTALLPDENYIYIADEKYCPYGDRGDDFLKERLMTISYFIKRHNPKAVVIACNTASRFKNVFENALSCPVFDVIMPTVNYVTNFISDKKVVVLATESTINGGMYQSELKKRGVNVDGIACNSFVYYIENGKINCKEFEDYVAKLFSRVKIEDYGTVVYGCTHYGYIDNVIRKFLPCGIMVVECGIPTALSIKESNVFSSFNLVGDVNFKSPIIVTTSAPTLFKRQLSFYGKKYFNVYHVDVQFIVQFLNK